MLKSEWIFWLIIGITLTAYGIVGLILLYGDMLIAILLAPGVMVMGIFLGLILLGSVYTFKDGLG